MVEDKTTHHRFRLDTLIEEQLNLPTGDMTFEQMATLVRE